MAEIKISEETPEQFTFYDEGSPPRSPFRQAVRTAVAAPLDVAATIASGALTQPVAGLAGLLAPLGGIRPTTAVEDVLKLSYQPRTEAAGGFLNLIGELSELPGQALGEGAYGLGELLGLPPTAKAALATAGRITPDAALLMLGLRGAPRPRALGVQTPAVSTGVISPNVLRSITPMGREGVLVREQPTQFGLPLEARRPIVQEALQEAPPPPISPTTPPIVETPAGAAAPTINELLKAIVENPAIAKDLETRILINLSRKASEIK